MNCKSAQDWLLQAESLRSRTWPTDVGQHVDGCAHCAKVVRDLREVEDMWREQPLPAGAKRGMVKLLNRNAKLVPAAPLTSPTPKRFAWILKPVPWVAAAAMFMVGISIFGWMMRPSSDKHHQVAEADVV